MEMNSMPSIEDFRAAFGMEDSEPAEPETTPVEDETQPETTPPSEAGPENQSEEQSPPEQEQQSGQQPTEQPQARQEQAKQNQAFARMRTENAEMRKTLNMMAEILGVDARLPTNEMSAILQKQARSALAKKNNIDPQILERLDHLEAINAEYTQMQLQQKATTAFQNIQNNYGATDADLTAFVDDLMREGFDLSDPKADLEVEFIRRNFAAIQKRAIDQAVAAEQERATKAGGASRPAKKQGQEDNSEHGDITTLDALNKFFEENTK